MTKPAPIFLQAMCELKGSATIGGVLFLREHKIALKGTTVSGQITGLTTGKHGFHIHELGAGKDCLATGGHYNPLK